MDAVLEGYRHAAAHGAFADRPGGDDLAPLVTTANSAGSPNFSWMGRSRSLMSAGLAPIAAGEITAAISDARPNVLTRPTTTCHRGATRSNETKGRLQTDVKRRGEAACPTQDFVSRMLARGDPCLRFNSGIRSVND